MYEVTLKTVGNPDFGQYAPVSPALKVRAETFAALEAQIDAYIEEYGVGGGNWVTPKLLKDGQVVGYMSYNRRVWKTPPATHTYRDGDRPQEVILV